MNTTNLKCLFCGEEYELMDIYSCKKCGGILDVKYDYQKIFTGKIDKNLPKPGLNIWRYKKFLPIREEKNIITLFEGGTPLIAANKLSKLIGIKRLYLKDETRNPTCSFKDRSISVGVSKALEFRSGTVVIASSGNGAASLAAYASKAGLKNYIFIPEKTPIGKISQATIMDSNIIKVKGNYSNSYKLAKEVSEYFSWNNITTTFLNPYSFEGNKTISYELYHQLKRKVPDWIFVPTGAGPLAYEIYKGYYELFRMNLINKIPRLAVIQAKGCSPIVRAYKTGKSHVSRWKEPSTIASAIADPLEGYEKDGELVLRVIKNTGGYATTVSDKNIAKGVRILAGSEGIYVEPSAAISVMGLKELITSNIVKEHEIAVCILTGHGLKDHQKLNKDKGIPVVKPELKDFVGLVGRKKINKFSKKKGREFNA